MKLLHLNKSNAYIRKVFVSAFVPLGLERLAAALLSSERKIAI
jgi:hypothetical protein